MASSPNTEKAIAYALLVLTAVTGLVDAVSFLSLGHVFTANMTGNIVLLAFATAHVSGLSIARSLTALLAFLVGAILGGRAMARANPDSTRNPGSDDNGPDINDYRHRRGLFARKRQQPEIGEKGCVGGRNVFGCGVGCGHHTLLDLSGLVAWDSDLRLVQCGIISRVAHAR